MRPQEAPPAPAPVAPAAAASAGDAAAGAAAQDELAAAVDRALAEAWKAQGLPIAAPADDATWLRRLSIDLCGVIPGREEAAAFLADPAPDKRARKIAEYLADRRFAENLSHLWTNLLLAEAGKDGERTRPWLRTWLEEELAGGARFSAITRRLIADAGASRFPGSTAFMLTYRDSLETLTGITARAFLGLQIQCAQCHDDPKGTWKQQDFRGFTGFFADMYVDHAKDRASGSGVFRILDREPLDGAAQSPPDPSKDPGKDPVEDPGEDPAMDPGMQPGQAGMQPGGEGEAPVDRAALRELLKLKLPEQFKDRVDEIIDDPEKFARIAGRLPPGALEMLDKLRDRRATFGAPSFPDGTPYVAKPGETKRAALAGWIVARDNPWFARAIVNRTWAHLFGKGLVEPVDDLSGSTDAALPEVLDELARAFAAHDADLRFLVGALVRTQAYARGASASADPQARAREERWFAAHPLRPLTAEQVASSLLRLRGGEREPAAPRNPRRERTSEKAELIGALRRPFGVLDGGGAGGAPPGIPQALYLMNGAFSQPPESLTVADVLGPLGDAARDPVERLTPLFHALLGRPPSAREAAGLLEHAGDDDARTLLARVYWALLNSTEFHTNR